MPTIIVALSGSAPERTLYRHARKLKDQIESIPTVLEANLSGHREELLEVVIDTMKAGVLPGYPAGNCSTPCRATTSLSPPASSTPARAASTSRSPASWRPARTSTNLPIKQNGEGVVTLGDVAEIRRTFKDASRITRVNGERAINLEVVKRLGTNVIENNAEVRRVVDAYTKNWPETIKVHYLLDKSKSTNEILQSLQSSIMTAIFLVMALVVAALGLRSALLVGIAIPTSFMVGFLMLGAIGMTVNMMVMFGLVLTVGMLVDGAIVIVEYADRKIHEGMHPDEAYVRAAKLMLWPIVASTGTTLAAFPAAAFVARRRRRIHELSADHGGDRAHRRGW